MGSWWNRCCMSEWRTHIVERHQRHALVVGQERGHDRSLRAVALPLGVLASLNRLVRRVVDGLVVAVPAFEAEAREPPQVAHGLIRLDHRGQHRRVRGDHQFVRQPPLQTQSRHAERLVLVVAPAVDVVEGRLRDPPGDAPRVRVVDLHAHHVPVRLIQERPGIRPGEQERHEVFEHRRAPRHERGPAADADEGAPQMEPVLLRHVALRNRDEAGEPRFRREQVVERRVKSTGPLGVRQPVADGKELAVPVEQRRKVRGVHHRLGPIGEILEAPGGLAGVARGGAREQALDEPPPPKQHILPRRRRLRSFLEARKRLAQGGRVRREVRECRRRARLAAPSPLESRRRCVPRIPGPRGSPAMSRRTGGDSRARGPRPRRTRRTAPPHREARARPGAGRARGRSAPP